MFRNNFSVSQLTSCDSKPVHGAEWGPNERAAQIDHFFFQSALIHASFQRSPQSENPKWHLALRVVFAREVKGKLK